MDAARADLQYEMARLIRVAAEKRALSVRKTFNQRNNLGMSPELCLVEALAEAGYEIRRDDGSAVHPVCGRGVGGGRVCRRQPGHPGECSDA